MKTRRILSLIVGFGLLVSSCQKDDVATNNSVITKMTDLKVDGNFKFNTTQLVQLNLKVNIAGMTSSEKFLFTVYDIDPKDGGSMLARGMADNANQFQSELNVPTALNSLFVSLRSSYGRVENKTIDIMGATVSSVFEQANENNTAAARIAAGPSCSSGCGVLLTSNVSNYTLPQNTQVCLAQGATMSGTITFQPGSKLRVCGNFNPQNINANGGAALHIVVTETGTLSAQTINMNSRNDSLLNYSSNATLAQSLNIQGYVGNYGTMTVQQTINVNNSGNFYNGSGAVLRVAESMNVNEAATNDGQINVTKSFHVNGQATAINNCKLYVGENLEQNKNFTNNGYVQVTQTTNFNGGGTTTLGAGSLLVTANLNSNGTVAGPTASYAKIKISSTTRLNGGGSYSNKVDICDANGIESNNQRLPSSVTTNCTSYIPSNNCNPGDGRPVVVDTDNDGAPDSIDEYPKDPNKAFNSYYPAKGVYGNVAFEDNWPSQADYDMNDLVMAYNYQMVTNAQNKYVEITGRYKVRAYGAKLDNGFGVSFPFSSSAVQSISGTVRASNFIKDNANGSENGHGSSNTVVVVYDAISTKFGNAITNTVTGGVSRTTDTATVVIKLASAQSSIGSAPFNQFLIINKTRRKEVHLKGSAPTDLAARNFFGYADDRSVGTNTYTTANGLPWAIDIPETFAYPKEYTDITEAYTKFALWAQKNGASWRDWYRNTSGYRVDSKIY
jgi:LruC domain-containing protein